MAANLQNCRHFSEYPKSQARDRTWEWRNPNRTVSERILSKEAPVPSSGMAYG